MEMQQCIQRIKAVVNHLNETTIRVDQLDAINRIAASTRALNSVISDLMALQNDQRKEGVNKDAE